MSCRPMASTWRKPRVVTRAVRAPLPSRIMLVATVVPCSTRCRLGAAWPASSSARRMPVTKACEGSLGTLGVLARQIRPLLGAGRACAGKVPPISTAIASDVLGKAVDISVTMKCTRDRAFDPQLCRTGRVDHALGDGDAVEAARGIGADETGPPTLPYPLRCA